MTLDGFISWLLEVDGRLTFVVVPVEPKDSFAEWNWLWPTLLGGVLALLGSVVVQIIASRNENRARKEEQSKRMASAALSGYYKLAQWVNLIGNIKLHIDRCYEAGKEADLAEHEPFQIVGPAAGKFIEPQHVVSEELTFLFNKEHYRLIEDVSMIEQRAVNLHALLHEYTTQKLAFEAWIETMPGVEREVDGPMVSTSLPKDHQAGFETRAGQLNIILSGIFENLDDHLAEAQGALQSYVDAAKEVIGKDFPRMKLEFK